MIPTLNELTFDDEPHLYRLDGIEIPSVTRLLKPLNDDKYSAIPQQILKNAAEKGTAVHSAAEVYVKYGAIDVEDEYMPYFEAFRSWWDENNPKLLDSEAMVYHKTLHYAGTVDLLMELNGKITLCDIKTTSVMYDKTFSVQLEAYRQALKSHGIEVDGKMILQLKKDGKYSVQHYPTDDTLRWSVFLALLTLYNYTNIQK